MNIELEDASIVGKSSPDPLRFAFSHKTSAHVAGTSRPLAKEKVQNALHKAFSGSAMQNSHRCLYIHIPFCRVRCSYCNFFQYATNSSLIEQYFNVLLQEIRWKSLFSWSQSAPFQAVYIGGGTPTNLSAQQLQQLGEAIRHSFPLAPDCEITLEGRINRFGEDKFEAALEGGFNRFSFGVQSFDNHVRRAAKRLDNREAVIERIHAMSRYNAAPIVIDLLFGLPYQTLDIWQDDLQQYLESGADGVDLYQLIEMQGLPMERMVSQGKLPHPADTQMKATMFEMGVSFMARHYQRRLSVSHWASSNRERSIYNSLAKNNAEVLPLGAGAGGNVNGLQMMNHRDMDQYCQSVKQQQFPAAMALHCETEHQLYSVIKAGFDRGVLSKHALKKIGKQDVYEQLTPLFLAWQNNGLVKLDGDYLSLSLAGEFWSVNLAQNVITVLQKNQLEKRVA